MKPSCLWIRRRIGPYLDRALPESRARGVARHVSGCAGCRQWVQRHERLTALLRGVAAETTEPNWSGFWPGLRTRILSASPLGGGRPTHPRWVPRALPGWPRPWLPRLAVGSAMAAILLVGLFFWRSDEPVEPQIPGVVVRALEMSHPNTSVMVFSAPEHEMTVIWVFGLDPAADQSRRRSEEAREAWHWPPSSARSWV